MTHPVLSFLFDYLSDLHIQYALTDGAGIDLSSLDLGLRNSILKLSDSAPDNTLTSLEKNTIYHITDYYECSYSFFQFPEEKQFLFIGPYLAKEIPYSNISALMEKLQIPAELLPQLQNYYYSLPVLPVKSSFSALLSHAYASIFSSDLPSVHYLDLKTLESQQKFLETHHFFVPEDSILSMHLLEERYHIEDDFLDAIAHGNTAKALSIADSMGTFRLAPRAENDIRDRKNLLLVLNTLMRHTAYTAGVHLFYIYTVFTNYSILIL